MMPPRPAGSAAARSSRRPPVLAITALASVLLLGLTTAPPAMAQPGTCPPGLAKKGCIPPGQAKKWQVGELLPSGTFYTVIDAGRVPPPGARYVRVDQDVLLIAAATGRILEILSENY